MKGILKKKNCKCCLCDVRSVSGIMVLLPWNKACGTISLLKLGAEYMKPALHICGDFQLVICCTTSIGISGFCVYVHRLPPLFFMSTRVSC